MLLGYCNVHANEERKSPIMRIKSRCRVLKTQICPCRSINPENEVIPAVFLCALELVRAQLKVLLARGIARLDFNENLQKCH